MIQLNAILTHKRTAKAIHAWLLAASVSLLVNHSSCSGQESVCLPIDRRLPPVGLEIPESSAAAWKNRLAKIDDRLRAVDQLASQADITVLTKACRYAILHQEFYQEKDFAKVDRLLNLAQQRIDEAERGEASWAGGSGRQVRGFESSIDGSSQPVGLIVPDGWESLKRPAPLYVWLHGRGEKTTDLHFICQRLDQDGPVSPSGAFVVHPFGRQCVGYKSAGETDVMEAIDFVCENYPIDRDRIVLMGFSMGGAGVWHLAAHYGERFVAASPGAGFAETARYQRLKPDGYPPIYEQMLWAVYDVPGYVRNLFNLDLIAYSGENDTQIQAAQVMEEAFEENSRSLQHLIGPGMGHKYHPDVLAEILDKMAQSARRGRIKEPQQFYLQTKHLRYSTRSWVQIDGMEMQYQDTRVDATKSPRGWALRTSNASRLRLSPTDRVTSQPVVVDGTSFVMRAVGDVLISKVAGKWQEVSAFSENRKRPKLSGPIDDAFIDPFLVIVPTGSSTNQVVDRWVQCELENFVTRWRALFRGDVRIKRDIDVTQQDLEQYHSVVWGTPQSNSVLQKAFLAGNQQGWPLDWSGLDIAVSTNRVSASENVLIAIQPNPLAREKYLVINSGPTFRQAHDRTNSLQNPHLPDWAIISLEQPPNDELPGKVVKAGFFDDSWQVSPSMSW